jgi:hypothetical protein
MNERDCTVTMQRLIWALDNVKRKRRKALEAVIREAIPEYDEEYEGDWSMDKLLARIEALYG